MMTRPRTPPLGLTLGLAGLFGAVLANALRSAGYLWAYRATVVACIICIAVGHYLAPPLRGDGDAS